MNDNDNEDGLPFSDLIKTIGVTKWMNFQTHN